MTRPSFLLKSLAFVLFAAGVAVGYAMKVHPTYVIPCCLYTIGCLLGSTTITDARSGKVTKL